MLLAVGLVLGVTACSSTPEEEDARARQRAVEWLSEQPGVTSAVVEPTVYADDTDDWLRVETTAALPESEVLALVDAMQEEVHSYDRYGDRVLLSVDGFETLLYPGSGHQVLDPALWLRGDGRADAAVVGDYPDYVVTAPPCDVFGVVADYDERAGEQGRTTREVRSPDGSARVRWTRAHELGMELPREAVGQLDDLCAEHPGTRGWVEGVGGDFDEIEGAVLLDPADIGLDEVVADVDAVVDDSLFPQGLLLGWGGLRAGADVFAETFSGERREWAEIALDAGADRVLGPPDAEYGGDRRLVQLQVSDLDAWGAVHDRMLEAAGTEYLPIDLFRERPEEGAVSADGAIHGSSTPLPAGSTVRDLVVEVAPVPSLREVSVSAGVRLVVGGDAGDDELDLLLGATAKAYPRLDEEYLQDGMQAQFVATEGFGTQESYRVVGAVVDDAFVPDPDAVASGSALPARYAAAWDRVT